MMGVILSVSAVCLNKMLIWHVFSSSYTTDHSISSMAVQQDVRITFLLSFSL